MDVFLKWKEEIDLIILENKQTVNIGAQLNKKETWINLAKKFKDKDGTSEYIVYIEKTGQMSLKYKANVSIAKFIIAGNRITNNDFQESFIKDNFDELKLSEYLYKNCRLKAKNAYSKRLTDIQENNLTKIYENRRFALLEEVKDDEKVNVFSSYSLSGIKKENFSDKEKEFLISEYYKHNPELSVTNIFSILNKDEIDGIIEFEDVSLKVKDIYQFIKSKKIVMELLYQILSSEFSFNKEEYLKKALNCYQEVQKYYYSLYKKEKITDTNQKLLQKIYKIFYTKILNLECVQSLELSFNNDVYIIIDDLSDLTYSDNKLLSSCKGRKILYIDDFGTISENYIDLSLILEFMKENKNSVFIPEAQKNVLYHYCEMIINKFNCVVSDDELKEDIDDVFELKEILEKLNLIDTKEYFEKVKYIKYILDVNSYWSKLIDNKTFII